MKELVEALNESLKEAGWEAYHEASGSISFRQIADMKTAKCFLCGFSMVMSRTEMHKHYDKECGVHFCSIECAIQKHHKHGEKEVTQ